MAKEMGLYRASIEFWKLVFFSIPYPTTAQYRPVQSNTSTAQDSQVQPIPEPDLKPELFGQTRPEPDPKSKSPIRHSLPVGDWNKEKDNFL